MRNYTIKDKTTRNYIGTVRMTPDQAKKAQADFIVKEAQNMKTIIKVKFTDGTTDIYTLDPQDLNFELAGLMTDREVKSFSIECIKEA